MKPSDLARSLPLGPHPPREVRTYIAIAFGYLTEQIRDLTLESGEYPHDVSDYRKLLRQVTEAVTIEESRPVVDATAETQAGAPRRLRLDGSVNSRFEETCNRCGHVHQGRICGMQMGGGPECKCELEGVPA